MSTPIVFAVPGDLNQLTGGYIFDRRVVEGLRERGRRVDVVELQGRFPEADSQAREAARALLGALSPDETLVIDGLALPAFESALLSRVDASVIGFVHHPLSLETGLRDEQVTHYERLEAELWQALDGIICASPSSARAVIGAGVYADRVLVASPGVALPDYPPVRLQQTLLERPVRLLCVATLTARKGHRVLIDALSRLAELDWVLDCYGSLERDRETVLAVRRAIDKYGLGPKVSLHGEQPESILDEAWRHADVFVLPSLHEGYGMVLTEAIAHGLPVVSTRAGAIPETVPAAASLLVAPGNIEALSAALSRVIEDTHERQRLTEAALAARNTLASWSFAIERWGEALDSLVLQRKALA